MAAAIRSMNKYLSLMEAQIREAEETPKAPDAPYAGQNNPGVKFQMSINFKRNGQRALMTATNT